jgi:hypothetical protein
MTKTSYNQPTKKNLSNRTKNDDINQSSSEIGDVLIRKNQ